MIDLGKCLKYIFLLFFADAYSGILDGDMGEELIVGRLKLCSDRDGALCRKFIGVPNEIVENLLHSERIAQNSSIKIDILIENQRYGALGMDGFNVFAGFLDNSGQVKRNGLDMDVSTLQF